MHRRRLLPTPQTITTDEESAVVQDHQDPGNGAGSPMSPSPSKRCSCGGRRSSSGIKNTATTTIRPTAYATIAVAFEDKHDPRGKAKNLSTCFGSKTQGQIKNQQETKLPRRRFYAALISLLLIAYLSVKKVKMTLVLGGTNGPSGEDGGRQSKEILGSSPLNNTNNYNNEPSFQIIFDHSWTEDGGGVGRLRRPFLLLRPMRFQTQEEHDEYYTPSYGSIGFYSLGHAPLFYRNIHHTQDEELANSYRSKILRMWDNWPPAKLKLARHYEPAEDLEDSIVGSRRRLRQPSLSSSSLLAHNHANVTENDDTDATSHRDNQEDEEEESLPTRSCHRAKWQETAYPNCNALHELVTDRPLPDTGGVQGGSMSIRNHPRGHVAAGVEETAQTRTQSLQQYNISYVGHGYFRHVYAFQSTMATTVSSTTNYNGNPSTTDDDFVYKRLRYIPDFPINVKDIYKSRREAIIMERLQSSSRVVNIYGYCGTTILAERMIPRTETLSGGQERDVPFWEEVVPGTGRVPDEEGEEDEESEEEDEDEEEEVEEEIGQPDGNNETAHRVSGEVEGRLKEEVILPENVTNTTTQSTEVAEKGSSDHFSSFPSQNNLTADEKLDLALQMAEAVADLHGFSDGVVLHLDVHIKQWFRSGGRQSPNRKGNNNIIIKLNDFNNGELLEFDVEEQTYCPVERWSEGRYRSPEEAANAMVDEGTDTFSLGNNFYCLLTGLWPFYEWSNYTYIREKQMNGERTVIDPRYRTSSFAESKLVEITEQTWEFDPDKRVDVFTVVRLLRSAINENNAKQEMIAH